MTEEEREKREEERRAWLGEPAEHGGEYRRSRPPEWAADAGCCLLEVGAAATMLLALIVLPAWLLLS